jgi:hypothetical protein
MASGEVIIRRTESEFYGFEGEFYGVDACKWRGDYTEEYTAKFRPNYATPYLN